MHSTPDTITLGDLEVHRLAYGAMRITGEGVWGEPADPAAAVELLRHVVRSGVDLIDTADSYGPDVSENLIARALHPYPEGLAIATKGGLTRSGSRQWHADCRPERLKRCCEDSLRRLAVDRIDLYQLHTVDSSVPLEDSVGALAELRDAGKIRHAGLCNVTAEQLQRAREVVPIVSVQNRYNLADRDSEELLRTCEREGLGSLPWFPLATGDLANPGPLDEIGGTHDATPAQVALAWLLHHSPVTVPIPGTSSVEHFEENMGAASLKLTDQDLEALDGVAAPTARS